MLMVATALITRLPFFGHPAADFDEQLYSLIGQQMQHGLLPYVDLWDRKPLGLFLIYRFAHAMGGDGPLAYQTLAFIVCLIGGFQIWRLAQLITDKTTAAFVSPLYPALMAVFDCQSSQSEIFFVPLLMAMAQLLLAASRQSPPVARRYCMIAMALGGMALQIKYTALFQCLFFGVGALGVLHRNGTSRFRLVANAGIFAALGILPTGLAAGFYAWKQHFGDFYFANFQSIGLRSAMPLSQNWGQLLLFAIPAIAIVFGGIVSRHRLSQGAPRSLWQLSLVWLGFSFAGFFMVSTIYFYYYAALIPATILAGLPLFDSNRRAGSIALAIVLGGMVIGYNPLSRLTVANADHASLQRMAQRIAPHVGPISHCLYVFDGPTALYRLTRSGLPTRLIYPDHLNNVLEARALPVDPVHEVIRIFAQRPGVVVISPDPVTAQNPATNAAVARELAEHYRQLGQWILDDRRLVAFERLADQDSIAPACTRR